MGTRESTTSFWREVLEGETLKSQGVRDSIRQKIFDEFEVKTRVEEMKLIKLEENEVTVLVLSSGQKYLFCVKVERTNTDSFEVTMIYKVGMPEGMTAVTYFEEE